MNTKKIKKSPAKQAKTRPAKKVSAPSSKKTPPKKPASKIEVHHTFKPVQKIGIAAGKTPAVIAKIEPPKMEPKPVMNKTRPKSSKKSFEDDLPLDLEEKEDLFEEEKRDLVKALRDDDDDTLDTSFVPTDTSERYILVVDEEGHRRKETVTIISQILPNAIIEVADDPEEASEIMQDCDFDTYVVNFLMPGYSASPFVKAVANHLDHPLLLGFAADKISDAIDPKKGLKIIPLKRLFDLDTSTGSENTHADGAEG